MPILEADTGMVTLQNLMLPEQGICTESALYFHLSGNGAYRQSTGEVFLEPGTTVEFGTYFNAFSIGKWHEACDLDGLFLSVTGSGLVEIKVWHAIPDRSWEMLCSEVLTLSEAESVFDLSHYTDNATRGVIYFEIRSLAAEGMVVVGRARFLTRAQPPTLPELAICITTFRREEEVRKTADRLQKFLTDFRFGRHIRVLVVDNGNSAEVPQSEHVRQIANPNLGGAGGFARGLAEAESLGATHCLFMDDDASFHMENIARTYMLLAYSRDSRNAVAGAMINNTHKWAMWENGAVFDRACKPQFCGVDLRRRENVLDIEFTSALESRPNFYGGWWFFAFPIRHVERRPFPFFVRGDDVSFSIANDFRIITLNGVVSFQDDFTEKESPQTLYLDLRSHLVHHLVFDEIRHGALGTAKVALRFIARSLARFHYETVDAQILAWNDVMSGPEFFAKNADMAERRQTIRNLTKNEAWQPIKPAEPTDRKTDTRLAWFRSLPFILTLNGHFLPFFGLWGRSIVLTIMMRGMMHPVWGAAQITYLNGTRTKGYTVRHSKARFFAQAIQIAGCTLRFVRQFEELKRTYRKAYPEMTSQGFWDSKFGATATDQAVTAPSQVAASA